MILSVPISRWNFYNMKNISGASEFHFWQLLIKIQNTALRWQSLLFFYFSDPQILTALRKEERKGGIFCRLRPRPLAPLPLPPPRGWSALLFPQVYQSHKNQRGREERRQGRAADGNECPSRPGGRRRLLPLFEQIIRTWQQWFMVDMTSLGYKMSLFDMCWLANK